MMTGVYNRSVFQRVNILDEFYLRKDSCGKKKKISRNFVYCVCKAVLRILSELNGDTRKDVSVSADGLNAGIVTSFLTL